MSFPNCCVHLLFNNAIITFFLLLYSHAHYVAAAGLINVYGLFVRGKRICNGILWRSTVSDMADSASVYTTTDNGKQVASVLDDYDDEVILRCDSGRAKRMAKHCCIVTDDVIVGYSLCECEQQKNTEVKRNQKWHDERLARSRKSIVALSSAVEKERNQNARIQCLRLHVFLFFCCCCCYS